MSLVPSGVRFAAGLFALCVLSASCGGGEDSSATTTSTTAVSTTVATTAPSTTVATTTTTEATTTTTTMPPTIAVEDIDISVLRDVADSLLLQPDDFVAGWDTSLPSDDSTDYSDVPDCGFMVNLESNDGSTYETSSKEFTQGDLSIRHEVRLYEDVAAATDVVLAWAEQATVDCVVAAVQISATESLNAGELDPYTEVDFSLQAYEDHIGEPRLTNLELTSTLIAPDEEAVVVNDAYFVQVGRYVSGVFVFSPGSPWEGTADVIDLIRGRMLAAVG